MRDSGYRFSNLAVAVKIFVAFFLKIGKFPVDDLGSAFCVRIRGCQSNGYLCFALNLVFNIFGELVKSAPQKNDLNDR